MFPRPRKITRLLVLSLAVVFIFSTYTFLFGNPTPSIIDPRHLETVKMGVQARSVVFNNQYALSGSLVSADSSARPEPTETFTEEDAAEGYTFQKSVQDRIQNSDFFKKRRKLLDKMSLSGNDTPEFSITTSPSQSFVNPHDFKYIHNPSTLCTGKSVSFLVYIHSSPSNLKKRQAIRQSWGNSRLLSLFNATMVFILGGTPDNPLQKLVGMESEEYGDIVQEDFLDSYRNLTYKGMTALKWISHYCNRAAFVLKADDDILLDVVSVIDHLISKVVPSHGPHRLVLCNLWTRMKTMRNPKSKWYLSKEEFPHDVFPPYCSGSFFLLSTDLVPEMYQASLNTPFFWVDDYFITGALVNSLHVKHVPFNQGYLLNYNVVEDRLKNDRKEYLVFHIKKLSLFQKLWPLLMRRHKGMKSFIDYYSLPFSSIIRNKFYSDHRKSSIEGGKTTSVDNLKKTLSPQKTTLNGTIASQKTHYKKTVAPIRGQLKEPTTLRQAILRGTRAPHKVNL